MVHGLSQKVEHLSVPLASGIRLIGSRLEDSAHRRIHLGQHHPTHLHNRHPVKGDQSLGALNTLAAIRSSADSLWNYLVFTLLLVTQYELIEYQVEVIPEYT